MTFDPQDPKWTAYVAGELEADERTAIERELEQSVHARILVADIRKVVGLLVNELQAEPMPTTNIELAQADSTLVVSSRPNEPSRRRRRVLWYLMGIAASVLVVAGLLLPAIQGARESGRRPQLVASTKSQQNRVQSPPRSEEQLEYYDSDNPKKTSPFPFDANSNPTNEVPDFSQSKVEGHALSYGGASVPGASPLRFSDDSTVRSNRYLPSLGHGPGGAATLNSEVPTSTAPLPPVVKSPEPQGPSSSVTKSLNRPTPTAPYEVWERSLLPRDGETVDAETLNPIPRTTATGKEVAGGEKKEIPTNPAGGKTSTGRFILGVDVNSDAGVVGSIVIDEPSPPGFRTRHVGGEAYDHVVDNPFLPVSENPLSTFSIDVDTASYSNIRRFLTQNRVRPPKGAVRIEEMINYFRYDYPQPDGEAPFSANVEVAGCPWNAEHRLVRVGLKGREVAAHKRPASNLVFLVDVSGSMQPANKLPLVKEGLKMLTRQLTENDRVAIVVYAGNSGLVLPSTTGNNQETILAALDRLEAGGSTNGGQGIQLAYEIASLHFVKGGTNRVILATDGDFNVGITDRGDLISLIEQQAKTGVFLTALGFGMGNIKDATLEQLADKGNGAYAYVDDLREAKKVLVDELSGTLITIAKDVKIQIEFNPAEVGAFRLIGYENRVLKHEDFNNDKKDAGEIGAGHTVTALYELVPAGQPVERPAVDPLKYQPKPTAKAPKPAAAHPGELLTLKLRYKQPDGETSKLLEHAVKDSGQRWAQASRDFKFAASVALFGMILRDSPHKGTATLDAVVELANEGRGSDESGYRAEFIELVRMAQSLWAK